MMSAQIPNSGDEPVGFQVPDKKNFDNGTRVKNVIVSVKSVNKIAIVVNIDIAEIMAKIIGTILSLSPPFLALFLAIISLTFVCEAM